MNFDVNFDQFQSLTYDDYDRHCQWMERAIALAQAAGESGEIPVGALIVDDQGKLWAEAANNKVKDNDATAHAEIIAIRKASDRLKSWRLDNFTLYVTLEPCPMCAGAIIQARLKQLVYGVDDPKTGAVRSLLNLPDSAASNHHLLVLGGIQEKACRDQLQAWFAHRRCLPHTDRYTDKIY